MQKLQPFLAILSLSLLLSSCSFAPEPKIVTETKVVKPTIAIASKPRPIELYEAKVIVITENNVIEVMEEMKASSGYFVVYGLDPQSFKNLATSFEEIKRYIQQQNEVILYYEKAVSE